MDVASWLDWRRERRLHCEWVWRGPAGARLFRGLVLFLVITVQVAALHRRSTEWPLPVLQLQCERGPGVGGWRDYNCGSSHVNDNATRAVMTKSCYNELVRTAVLKKVAYCLYTCILYDARGYVFVFALVPWHVHLWTRPNGPGTVM